ncbi:MAG: MIP/aquaporin family protein [Phycisphaerales bacterium]
MAQFHWAEYAIEAALLGIFMVAACVAAAVFEHPGSPVLRRFKNPLLRRALIGTLMGLTAIVLIYSAPGQRSGAHMNPGTTLAFFTLGKVRPIDAAFYILAQFVGGFGGVLVARAALRRAVAHNKVRFAATTPGPKGLCTAWIAEFTIAFLMMSMVLWSSNLAATAPYTGIFAGLMVATFITIEAPLSGMSMNPARTLGSALHARAFRGLWIYFTAPPLAMLGASLLFTSILGSNCVYCAKLEHPHNTGDACIFNCHIEQMPGWWWDVTRSSHSGISTRLAR